MEGITDLLEKRNPFISQDFIRLALDAMNFSDLAKHITVLEQEEPSSIGSGKKTK
jgi:hypothetical protein